MKPVGGMVSGDAKEFRWIMLVNGTQMTSVGSGLDPSTNTTSGAESPTQKAGTFKSVYEQPNPNDSAPSDEVNEAIQEVEGDEPDVSGAEGLEGEVSDLTDAEEPEVAPNDTEYNKVPGRRRTHLQTESGEFAPPQSDGASAKTGSAPEVGDKSANMELAGNDSAGDAGFPADIEPAKPESGPPALAAKDSDRQGVVVRSDPIADKQPGTNRSTPDTKTSSVPEFFPADRSMTDPEGTPRPRVQPAPDAAALSRHLEPQIASASPVAGFEPTESTSRGIEVIGGLTSQAGSDQQTAAAPSSALATAHRPDVARHAATQMAQVVLRQPDQPVEIALNPEELGRVRMALSTGDGGITVAISAERFETLDLLRRNIDQLAAEFAAMGFTDVGFQFDQDARADQSPSSRNLEDGGDVPFAMSSDAPLTQRLVLATGLDLRL